MVVECLRGGREKWDEYFGGLLTNQFPKWQTSLQCESEWWLKCYGLAPFHFFSPFTLFIHHINNEQSVTEYLEYVVCMGGCPVIMCYTKYLRKRNHRYIDHDDRISCISGMISECSEFKQVNWHSGHKTISWPWQTGNDKFIMRSSNITQTFRSQCINDHINL